MAQQPRNKYQEQNVRLPLLGSMTNRNSVATKDQRFVNIFPETREVEAIESTKIFLNKRPGLTLYKDFGDGNGRGLAYFRNKIYACVDGHVYEDGVTPTSIITLTDANSKVGMLLANSSIIGDYLFICDGTTAWIVKQDGSVLSVGANGIGSVTINTAGSGYLTAPKVYFTGVGTGAAATAEITTGALSKITVTSSGSGYTTLPTISFSLNVTANHAADILFSAVPHQLVAGDRIKFATTGTIPTGLSTSTVYYVKNPTTDVFEVSLTNGGATVTFSDDGTGTLSIITGGPTTQGTATAVANNFPTPHVPIPAFIDGYILLAKGSDVYNCSLDEPYIWNAGEYLSAEMFPDPVVGLARQNNQVVVFGETTSEFFYDAANASGSPLNRNDSTILQIGCAFPYAIYQNESTCIFTGQSDSGGRAVWQLDGFKPTKISDEFIERILDQETNPDNVHGFGIRSMGHLFYLLTLPTLDRTLVYDTEEKLWHEWSSNNNGSHTAFSYNFMCDQQTGAAYIVHNNNGCVYKVDPTVYQDDGVNILVDLTTNKYDMDTYKRKFMRNMRVVGDRSDTVSVRWTDDDYQTWSNTKTIAMNDDFPNFARLGSFRRRAFNIKHSTGYPLRLESLEVSFYEGDS